MKLKADRRDQDRTPSDRHHIDSKNIRVILKKLSEKRSKIKILRQDSSPEHRRGEKESYSPIYN